jgi:very-short-patch-repair endonuclease
LNNRARILRKNMTLSERKMWEYLKKLPYNFLRQRIIDNFIVDFYCSECKLVIEIDGGIHNTTERIEYDEERTKILNGYGIEVIRFTNQEIDNEFEDVCQSIKNVFYMKGGK